LIILLIDIIFKNIYNDESIFDSVIFKNVMTTNNSIDNIYSTSINLDSPCDILLRDNIEELVEKYRPNIFNIKLDTIEEKRNYIIKIINEIKSNYSELYEITLSNRSSSTLFNIINNYIDNPLRILFSVNDIENVQIFIKKVKLFLFVLKMIGV
jgi:hypothetical protein